jgi:predicted negative regulator of RcsB-dependent stress response
MQYPKAATSNHSHGLPTAGLVGVIIGSALGLLLIVALIYLVFWRPRQKKKSQQQQQVAQQPYGQNSAGNVQPPANAYPVQFKQAYASDLNDESGKEVLDTMVSLHIAHFISVPIYPKP